MIGDKKVKLPSGDRLVWPMFSARQRLRALPREQLEQIAEDAIKVAIHRLAEAQEMIDTGEDMKWEGEALLRLFDTDPEDVKDFRVFPEPGAAA